MRAEMGRCVRGRCENGGLGMWKTLENEGKNLI